MKHTVNYKTGVLPARYSGFAYLPPRVAHARRLALKPLGATDDKKAAAGDGVEAATTPGPQTLPADANALPAGSSSSSSSPGPADPEAATIAELGTMWEAVKRDMRTGLSPDEAQVLDSIKLDDLMGDSNNLMRKIADEQLGPLLRSVGVSEDPLEFFVDLLRTATALQLLSGAALFYGTELLGGYDSGEAFRCVAGLTAGYLSRPFFKVEQLMWPLYDAVLKVVAPGAVYEVQPNPAEFQSTLSRLGVTIAACSFGPQLLWGWDTSTCMQLVLPLAAGWVLFDVMYMAALLAKLSK